jgi:hypothetical protein
MEANPNAVREWLYERLGNGDAAAGRSIADGINGLFSRAGLGEIECVVTQLAEGWIREVEERDGG